MVKWRKSPDRNQVEREMIAPVKLTVFVPSKKYIQLEKILSTCGRDVTFHSQLTHSRPNGNRCYRPLQDRHISHPVYYVTQHTVDMSVDTRSTLGRISNEDTQKSVEYRAKHACWSILDEVQPVRDPNTLPTLGRYSTDIRPTLVCSFYVYCDITVVCQV